MLLSPVYSISLITLILFFVDNYIMWWEAALLLTLYVLYVIFMKYNEQAERAVKRLLSKNRQELLKYDNITVTSPTVPVSHHSDSIATQERTARQAHQALFFRTHANQPLRRRNYIFIGPFSLTNQSGHTLAPLLYIRCISLKPDCHQ